MVTKPLPRGGSLVWSRRVAESPQAWVSSGQLPLARLLKPPGSPGGAGDVAAHPEPRGRRVVGTCPSRPWPRSCSGLPRVTDGLPRAAGVSFPGPRPRRPPRGSHHADRGPRVSQGHGGCPQPLFLEPPALWTAAWPFPGHPASPPPRLPCYHLSSSAAPLLVGAGATSALRGGHALGTQPQHCPLRPLLPPRPWAPCLQGVVVSVPLHRPAPVTAAWGRGGRRGGALLSQGGGLGGAGALAWWPSGNSP